MPKKQIESYKEWEAALLNQAPPQPHATIDDLLREVHLESADGSWESLFDYYTKKAARHSARGRGNANRSGLPGAKPIKPERKSFSQLVRKF